MKQHLKFVQDACRLVLIFFSKLKAHTSVTFAKNQSFALAFGIVAHQIAARAHTRLSFSSVAAASNGTDRDHLCDSEHSHHSPSDICLLHHTSHSTSFEAGSPRMTNLSAPKAPR
jgi:hypothetical protein